MTDNVIELPTRSAVTRREVEYRIVEVTSYVLMRHGAEDHSDGSHVGWSGDVGTFHTPQEAAVVAELLIAADPDAFFSGDWPIPADA